LKILRMSDRIKIEMGEITVKVSPIDHAAKLEISNVNDNYEKARLIMKLSLKEISGIECHDGTKYELKFENGKLSDDCANEITDLLLKTELPPKIVEAATSNIEKLDGVKFEIVPN